MTADAPKVNLLGLDRQALEAFFVQLGEKPFRARQLMKWVYHQGVADFELMTDLGKGLREKLKLAAEVRPPEVLTEQLSEDGTRKWLLRMDAANNIETVLIPDNERGTLCISSQVGCAMDCSFCATGKQGFNRNLTAAEIIGQVWMANQKLGAKPGTDRAITNIVFMGMGEPLANYKHVLTAIKVLVDDFGYGLSKRRVTVSTSGLVPTLDKLAEDCDVALAVSLHAPTDALRDVLVPINKVHPIEELMQSCRRYVSAKDHRHVHVTFEYVMLEGVNDSLEHAKQLAQVVKDVPCKVNLIPFNSFPGTEYTRSPQAVIDRFAELLWQKGIVTITRRTRGDDIDAACGQLAGKVMDRIRRAERRGEHLEAQP
ncbi:MAG TPA: 23S rRNA (adenine(2503)-C(2))-methyltransferase RlmN [Gammaproteobacteria bacterium]|nr:23S rRNA (adenine(2503)-C(2))-methyltransferase RlmN [Gammaproteobacteria bacterium]